MREQVRFGIVPRPRGNTASPRQVEILDSNKSRQKTRIGEAYEIDRTDKTEGGRASGNMVRLEKEKKKNRGTVKWREGKHQIEAAACWPWRCTNTQSCDQQPPTRIPKLSKRSRLVEVRDG